MVDPVLLATLSGLVASMVAIGKSIFPDLESRTVKIAVLATSAVVFLVALGSAAFASGVTPLQYLAYYISLAGGAIGVQTVATTAAPGLKNLYQIRKGTSE